MKTTYITLAFAGIVAVSCNKALLDTTPHDKYTEATFWTTPEAANAGLTGCYSVLRNDGVFGGKGSNNATALWDETLSPNAWNNGESLQYKYVANGTHMASTGGIISARYSDCYGGVGRCNTLLAKIDQVPGLDDSQKKLMKGQALFLRALYYFMLQNYYGGVPLILDLPNKDTQSQLPRNTREEVVAQVLKDLEDAAAMLPLTYGASDKGRATKGAAMSLKARVLLFEASPLLNPANDATKWANAAAAAKAVMDLGGTGYGLFNNYRNLFMKQNENNQEVIFDVQYLFPNQAHSFDLICSQYNSNAPVLGLAQAYYMKNGLPIADPASGYDPQNPYLNRDPRLQGTITYPTDIYQGKVVDTKRFAITGYGVKKFSVYDSIVPAKADQDLKGGQSDINFIVLRYADILMMYAEAQNEAVGPDATVYEALNKIRDRVKMPHFKPGLSKEEMRKEIRHERRVEFACEGLYYNDLRRWKTAEVEMNGPIYNYAGKEVEKRIFNPKRDYWWPIPQTEKDLNPNLEQNPGY
ncbi:RagB/SusD family nutrient uptake outer membrane protein [Chitinophaga qingshengii]|uniref:RagB/SusD family nutrient uptake outer membrane protein n=1 Tax=Chitinophaga qingshengii TaxID=1569794 RepID=A0ABR7TT88_9BACT|nr:RagB/SusD family nutrient uptake outer membrane protein [Chitinophaga qingshengii]MBC9933243.1 RagB/SusD family nutrient uptake outer membrane protein [Chitinophaga qingshengii]